MHSPRAEILIVGDSSTNRSTFARHLGDEYTIHFAVDGEQGWKCLQSNDSISLVFTDIQMPVMSGMLLLQKVRDADCERIANLPVIMITGREDSEAAKKAAHNIGATDFISKPFDKIDILSRVRSYTRLFKKISELEKIAAYDNLTGLYSNHMLLEFGNKTVSYAKRHNIDASFLFVEVADTKKLIETLGSKITETIISTVAGLLDNSLRKEELVSHINDGMFAIVLPHTKAFKAHIVATHLKQAVESLEFDISRVKIHVNLAIGLSSTEAGNLSDRLGFEEYCVQAAHALAASLETPNKCIIRYDETYEKKMNDDQESCALSKPAFTITDATGSEQDPMAELGDFLSSILAGDYSNIPTESLSSLIKPLESFLEYAHAAVQADKKASSE